MKKDNIKLLIFWVFSLIVIIFMMTFSAHASEPYFPMQQNESGDFTDYLDTINNYFDTENYYYVMYKSATYGDGVGFTYVKCLKSDGEFYGEISNDGYHWSLYRLNNPSSISVGVLAITYNQTVYDTYVGGNYGSFFTSLVSSNYDNNVSYVSNFRIYSNNTENAEVILKYGPDPIQPLPAGAAIEPLPFIVPEYFTGEAAPETVPPQVTINNYTWTTAPSFDNSSVINGIQSIKDTLTWLASNIHSEISNLLSNLKSLAVYIAETIQYYGNAIIETLNNLIQTFYNNMKSLVENISNQIEYIKEPLDQEIIWDNISTTSLVTNVNTIKTSMTSFQAAFTGVSEPNEYKIPIHLENLPSSWFGTQTTQYIDLGIINGTVKDGLRLFVWAMVTYGLVVTIFDSIANYINGGGDES